MDFEEEQDAVKEINVIPLIDIFAMLMIVFIISMPIALSGIDINLTKSSSKSNNIDQYDPSFITVSIKSDGYYINDVKLEKTELLNSLNTTAANNNQRVIYIMGDKNMAYGEIMSTMSMIKKSGYENVTLVTEYE